MAPLRRLCQKHSRMTEARMFHLSDLTKRWHIKIYVNICLSLHIFLKEELQNAVLLPCISLPFRTSLGIPLPIWTRTSLLQTSRKSHFHFTISVLQLLWSPECHNISTDRPFHLGRICTFSLKYSALLNGWMPEAHITQGSWDWLATSTANIVQHLQ